MVLNIGTTKHSFLDDYVVGRKKNVVVRLHRPIRSSPNPVVQADKPWETGVVGVDLAGGTVLFDQEARQFKMWYRTNQTLLEQAPDGSFREAAGAAYLACYAVSSDGLRWEKPDLGLTEFGGSTHNNILPPGKGGRAFIRRPNLIKDYDETDPRKRYKMVYLDEVDKGFALVTAYSADGVDWVMDADPPKIFRRPVIPNGVLFGWDPRLKEYVLYHRTAAMAHADVDGRQVRSDLRRLVRSSSPGFSVWGQTRTALALGRSDPANLDIGHLGILSAVLYTDDLYVGFVDTCTVHGVEDVPAELWDSVYKMDHAEHRQELVISRDGKKWTRVSPHWEFFRPGSLGAWDSNHVIPSKPIVLNDKIWIYYSAHSLSCKSYLPHNPDQTKIQASAGESVFGYAIGLATMRLDGFASMESYSEGGWVETKPLIFAGNRLVVNVRAPRQPFRPPGSQEYVFHGDRMVIRKGNLSEAETQTQDVFHGGFRVEIQDAHGKPLSGFSLEDCDLFSGDELRHVVSWKEKTDLAALAGEPVRLKFHLQNAALYSFQFTKEQGVEQSFDPACPGCRGSFVDRTRE